ncbi:MAG: DNA adenine methylase [Pseudomonadota bacterium]
MSALASLSKGAPTRPVLRWFGGKWRLAPWIISHFPAHRVYVEPFGGAGSVLLRKDRAYAEVWNDLEGEVVNLFEVLRSDDGFQLVELIRLTPFSRTEFERAYRPTSDPFERARRMVIRSFMGFGALGNSHQSTGFRANSNRSGTTPAHDWASYPEALRRVVGRLVGVTIENRDALDVMAQHDSAGTLHYVDPPYMHDTRADAKAHAYAHEMTDADHARLLAFLGDLKGMVVLSGYPHPLYDDALKGWQRVERDALADGARERTEVLWISPACSQALRAQSTPLFAGMAE